MKYPLITVSYLKEELCDNNKVCDTESYIRWQYQIADHNRRMVISLLRAVMTSRYVD